MASSALTELSVATIKKNAKEMRMTAPLRPVFVGYSAKFVRVVFITKSVRDNLILGIFSKARANGFGWGWVCGFGRGGDGASPGEVVGVGAMELGCGFGFVAVILLLEKCGGVVFVAVVLLREKWLALMLSRGFCRGGTSSGEVVGFIATCGWRSCELRVASCELRVASCERVSRLRFALKRIFVSG